MHIFNCTLTITFRLPKRIWFHLDAFMKDSLFDWADAPQKLSLSVWQMVKNLRVESRYHRTYSCQLTDCISPHEACNLNKRCLSVSLKDHFYALTDMLGENTEKIVCLKLKINLVAEHTTRLKTAGWVRLNV